MIGRRRTKGTGQIVESGRLWGIKFTVGGRRKYRGGFLTRDAAEEALTHETSAARGVPKPVYGFVYALRDPRDGATCYIGRTKDTTKRLRMHMAHAREGGRRPVFVWLRELDALGLRPTVEVLARAPLPDLPAMEAETVRRAVERGEPLKNVWLVP